MIEYINKIVDNINVLLVTRKFNEELIEDNKYYNKELITIKGKLATLNSELRVSKNLHKDLTDKYIQLKKINILLAVSSYGLWLVTIAFFILGK